MHIHLIDFEYFYKNDPETRLTNTMVCPESTSAEARLFFWANIGHREPRAYLTTTTPIEWDQVDSISITLVRSSFIK